MAGSVSSVSDLDGASLLLRSLADARDGPLHRLWTRLPLESHGRIDMRIYPIAGSQDAVHAVVGVTATRHDGRQVVWSVALDTDPSSAEVSGTVEVEAADSSFVEVFAESHQSQGTRQAAAHVRELAERVAETGTAWLR